MNRGISCRAHVAMFLVCATFSVQNVLAKVALAHVNPLVFALLRDCGATPFLVVYALIADGRSAWRPRGWKQWTAVAVGGGVGVCGTQLLYLVGLWLSSPTLCSIWNNGSPVLAGVFAWLLGQERFSLLRVAGLAAGAGGIALITAWGAYGGGGVVRTSATAQDFLLANVAMLGYAACSAAFVLMLPPLRALGASAASIIAWLYAFGALCLAALVAGYTAALALTPSANTTAAAAVYDGLGIDALYPPQENLSAIGAVAFSAIIGSALNYTLITWANPVVGPSLQALYGIVQIPMTAIVVLVAWRTAPTPCEWLATLVVVISLGFTTAARARDRSSAGACCCSCSKTGAGHARREGGSGGAADAECPPASALAATATPLLENATQLEWVLHESLPLPLAELGSTA